MASQQKGSATTDLGLLFLRVMIGSFMLFGHGWGKLIGYSEKAAQFADPIGLGSATSLGAAIFAEVFCSLLIILGIGTRLAAIPIIFTMLVAVTFVHTNDPWGKKEFALLYAIPLITLILTGGGRFVLGKRFPLLGPWS
jgi:putative oxidoreductase